MRVLICAKKPRSLLQLQQHSSFERFQFAIDHHYSRSSTISLWLLELFGRQGAIGLALTAALLGMLGNNGPE